MNIALKKTHYFFNFEQLRNNLFAIEIALFPWINYSDSLRLLFILILGINVSYSFYNFIVTGKSRSLTAIDIFLGCLILLSLFNPGSYWQESFSTENVIFRLSVYYLRYLTFPDDFLRKNINLLFRYFLISAFLVIFVWIFQESNLRLILPYGDPNYLGFIFGSYAILAMCYASSRRANTVSIMLIILCFYIVLLTASRGSILALVLASLLIFIKDIFRFLGVIVLLLFASQLEFVRGLYSDLFIIERILDPRDSDIGAANVRLVEIEIALKMLGNDFINALFGHGASTTSSEIFSDSSTRIHNSYVAIIFEQGIIGGIFALIIAILMLLKSEKNGLLPLTIFMLLNSMTVFIFTFYHFYIFVKLIQSKKP